MHVDKSLDRIIDEISEYHSLENSWPEEWEYGKVDDRIEKHHRLIEQLSKNGLKKVGEGGFRVVFEVTGPNLFGFETGCMLKVSKTDGTGQNRYCVEIYEQMSEGARKAVAGIIDHDEHYRWILQEKASSAKPGDSKKVMDRLETHNYSCSDIRLENCGRINGEPVLIDLGQLQE